MGTMIRYKDVKDVKRILDEARVIFSKRNRYAKLEFGGGKAKT